MSNGYSTSEKDLKEVAINVKRHLLLCCNANCTKQYTKSSTIWKNDCDYDWLLRLKCNQCKMKWAVCYKCSSCKTALLNTRQISLHKNSYHKQNRVNVLRNKKNDRLHDIEVQTKSKKQKVNDEIEIDVENSCDNNDLVLIEDSVKNDLVVIEDLVKNEMNLVVIEDSVYIDNLVNIDESSTRFFNKKGMVHFLLLLFNK